MAIIFEVIGLNERSQSHKAMVPFIGNVQNSQIGRIRERLVTARICEGGERELIANGPEVSSWGSESSGIGKQ